MTLPPLPSLTDAEWQSLPAGEKRRLRELKHAHRRMQNATGQSQPGSQQKLDPTKTPFQTIDGRPLHLDQLGGLGSCFIVLSGPSAKQHDLTLLHRRGAFTIAVNNAATLIRPNAWHFVDPPEKFHNAIWLDPAVMKFVPSKYLRWKIRTRAKDGKLEYMRLNSGQHATPADMPGVIQAIRNAFLSPSAWLSEPSINWGNSKRSARKNHFPRDLNVMVASLKLAFALGFRVAYLVGCDFSMSDGQPYAFAEDKHSAGVAGNNRKYEVISAILGLLKPHFDANGYRVFNLNANSGLRVFPFVSYQEAIEAATGHVPQDPLDTFGWYSKGG